MAILPSLLVCKLHPVQLLSAVSQPISPSHCLRGSDNNFSVVQHPANLIAITGSIFNYNDYRTRIFPDVLQNILSLRRQRLHGKVEGRWYSSKACSAIYCVHQMRDTVAPGSQNQSTCRTFVSTLRQTCKG